MKPVARGENICATFNNTLYTALFLKFQDGRNIDSILLSGFISNKYELGSSILLFLLNDRFYLSKHATWVPI
jgi:hypothetical protein